MSVGLVRGRRRKIEKNGPVSPAWKRERGAREGGGEGGEDEGDEGDEGEEGVGEEGVEKTSSRCMPAQREVLVSIPIRPDQCCKASQQNIKR